MTLTAAQILAADDVQTREVDVPEWGGTVIVRALTGTARDEFEASLREQRGNEIVSNTENIRAKLVGRALVDEQGNRLFTNAQINALGEKSADVLDRLFDIAQEMSGMSPKAVAEAEGNSETVPSDGSTSSEPTPPASQ